MITDSVILAASKTSKTGGGTGMMITSTLATRLTGRTKSCQRPNAEVRPVFVAIPAAIYDSGDSTSQFLRRSEASCPIVARQFQGDIATQKSIKTRGGKVSESAADVQPEPRALIGANWESWEAKLTNAMARLIARLASPGWRIWQNSRGTELQASSPWLRRRRRLSSRWPFVGLN